MVDVFCVGAPKTATTTLFNVLANAKVIYEAPMKEPHYLTYEGKRKFVLKQGHHKQIMDTWADSLASYQQNFMSAPSHLLRADFSTHYLREIEQFKTNGVALMGEGFLNVPIIVMLRNPTDRAFSHYAMKVRDGSEKLGFLEAIAAIDDRLNKGYLPSFDYLGFSKYKHGVEYLKKHFSKVLILDYREVSRDFDSLLSRIADFLAVDISVNERPPQLNKSGQPKNDFFSKLLHQLVFQDNWIKKMIPSTFKSVFANSVKKKSYEMAMTPLKITAEQRVQVDAMLKEEITFYNSLFY